MADIENFINSIVEQVRETEEEFIFETIRPYCEDIIERTIDKKFLSVAVVNQAGTNCRSRNCPRCNQLIYTPLEKVKGRDFIYCWHCGIKLNRHF